MLWQSISFKDKCSNNGYFENSEIICLKSDTDVGSCFVQPGSAVIVNGKLAGMTTFEAGNVCKNNELDNAIKITDDIVEKIKSLEENQEEIKHTSRSIFQEGKLPPKDLENVSVGEESQVKNKPVEYIKYNNKIENAPLTKTVNDKIDFVKQNAVKESQKIESTFRFGIPVLRKHNESAKKPWYL